jgi:methionyl-tRNA formyltransferase
MIPAPLERLRIVYFGMVGRFSLPPLEELLDAGHSISAIVTPRLENGGVPDSVLAAGAPAPPRATLHKLPRPVPQLAPPILRNIRQIAAREEIPLMEVEHPGAASMQDLPRRIAAMRPHAICVACFPYRLPQDIIRIPLLGSLNVHPSLLPDNRGPDPLFWTFQRGDAFTGVTIHLMDAGLDTGPILRQKRLEVPDGISEQLLLQRLADCGAELLREALCGLAAGRIQPLPQENARATRYPFPDSEDFVITPERPARWAYNFACGLYAREVPIFIQVEDRRFRLVEPVNFHDTETLPGRVWQLDGQALAIACTPGVFRARVAPLT